MEPIGSREARVEMEVEAQSKHQRQFSVSCFCPETSEFSTNSVFADSISNAGAIAQGQLDPDMSQGWLVDSVVFSS